MGVVWNIEKDVFQFEVFKPDKPATKRGILSAISSLRSYGFRLSSCVESKEDHAAAVDTTVSMG